MLQQLFGKSIYRLRTKAFGWKMPYDCDPNEGLLYLNAIKEPKGDIERSYAQYQCQCHLMGVPAVLAYNIGCFFVVVPFIIKCILGRAREKTHVDIVYTISIKDKSIIPSSLHTKYKSERVTDLYEGFLLKAKDFKYIKTLFFKYPFSYYFILRIIFKISIYRFFIEKYHPMAIAINSEYSSTSSVMTYYCESQGIDHINIMHGEKLLFIRDSFFRFTKCYVWDEYYINLFKTLRAADDQFVIERPQSLIIDTKSHKDAIPYCDYKYMLFENDKLESISRSMQSLKDKGYKVKVRPHPSYTDMEKLRRYFKDEDIEDTNVSIPDSISNSHYVISLASTVLLQSYFSNINIIIDDVNYKGEFSKLEELGYILINKKHKCLSDIIGDD